MYLVVSGSVRYRSILFCELVLDLVHLLILFIDSSTHKRDTSTMHNYQHNGERTCSIDRECHTDVRDKHVV